MCAEPTATENSTVTPVGLKEPEFQLISLPTPVIAFQFQFKLFPVVAMKKAHGDRPMVLSLSSSVCVLLPRHCASGLGHGGLYLGSAVPASYSGARLQTEAEHPVEQAYVLLMVSNERLHTHTHTYFHFHALSRNTNLSLWLPNSSLSNTYFLSLSWINCISHSREHIHTQLALF